MNDDASAIAVPSLPTSLDPRETNVDLRWLDQHPFPEVHANHRSERKRIIEMLATSEDGALRRRAWKLRDCCAHPTIRMRPDGSTYFSPSRCRDRLCPLCAKIEAKRTAKRVLNVIAGWDQSRHLVLTQKSTSVPLADQIDQLLSCFRRLRQRRWWKDRVNGGIGTLEITRNETTKQWHPHLHVILSGEYLPHNELKSQWINVTTSSSIVHITAVHSRDDASRYIAKYVSKPSDVAQLDQPSAEELALALVGRRTVIAFGTAHGSGLPLRVKAPDPGGSLHIAGLQSVRKALKDDLPSAKWAIHRLHQEMPSVGMWLDPSLHLVPVPGVGAYLLRTSTLVDLLRDCRHHCQTGDIPLRLNSPQPEKPLQLGLFPSGYP